MIKKVGALFTADQKKSGILASVSLAQFILESGYGKSELAQKANNCFGMKKSLSGNTWSGSVWDGKSIYTKKTKEQNKDGSYTTITADFRKYPSVEDSIADHSAYLLGAKNGSKKRYAGLKGCKDYKKAAKIIKAGGYATSLTYVDKLCSIIEKWKLTQYDIKSSSSSKKSIDTLAKEVIAGKWGNGEERKQKLTAAGYDYNAVQKRVNEMLS
ncbi:glucosaminidase domain-containing protein [uncultured Ruminococcus sp.]|uniref:glucosaminidase domain-containing protein n=1 Tax=uncultured Ruminococcus sp. TaxID=165186 RepID=UPI00338F2749